MRATQKESDGSPVSPAAAALALVPMIGELREEIEDGRCLPAALVDSMVQASLFQLGLPAVVGGPQHHPLTSFAAIETLARAEGAVGWCASIASSVSLVVGAWLAPEVVRAMVGAPPDLRVAGSVRAEGEAKKVEGGYRLNGRWDFASGIDHANWLYCSCRVINLTDAEDKPETRTLMVPRDEGSRIDTWTAAGMRGSGSHDFAVTDVFVSDARVITAGAPPRNDALLYHPRLVRISGWTTTAAVALGIARGALDALTDLSFRGTTMSTAALRERPAVQQAAGEAEAILGGARAYLM